MFSLFLVLMGSSATAGEPAYGGGLGGLLSGGDKGKAYSEEERRYIVHFQGKDYETLYEIQTDKGVPIDLYYYRIPPYKGVPAAQDGEDLWGRFVRVPSANYFDQSSVVWWHAWWTYENGRWLYHQADNIPPPKVTKEKKSGTRENMGQSPESGTGPLKKTPPTKETKKPDVPKEKKPPAGGPPRDLGEL
jgi:hypothetical protein